MSPLNILRCPFCGGRLAPAGQSRARASMPLSGVLMCQCCAFPVVDGIAYLRAGPAAEGAMRALGDGDRDGALRSLLGLDRSGWRALRRIVEGPRPTFRAAVDVLNAGGEGQYLLYRFSDPTYLRTRSLVRAAARCVAPRSPVLDLCGGAGHLSRALLEGGARPVVLADLSFAKVWLARRFVVPGDSVQAVCCDANHPLPFARGSFELVTCADAFHYIWQKRLLADELVRLVEGRPAGTILLPHLHNSTSWNYSSGMPLSAAGYRSLFEMWGLHVRLYADHWLPLDLPGRHLVDLSRQVGDGELKDEQALSLVAARGRRVFRRHVIRTPLPRRRLHNPLYRRNGRAEVLKLSFPSADYEAEYAECRRYLPDSVPADVRQLSRSHLVGGAALNLPDDYV